MNALGGNLPVPSPGRRAVAVSEPGKMLLGMARADVATITQLVERLRAAVEERAALLTGREEKETFYSQNWPLDFDWFCTYAHDLKSLAREYRRNGVITSVRDNAGLRGLCQLDWRPSFTPDLQGWVNYLVALNGTLADILPELDRAAVFNEADRTGHTLVVAPTDWGKSELLKAMAFHYAEHDGQAAVVVLDPGGDMVKQIARWPELVRSDRAVLIEPGLQPGKTVCFNPLDGSGLDEEGRREVAGFWAVQLGALTQETSVIMQRVARNCVHVLLAYPGGANFHDLYLLLTARSTKAPTPRQLALLKFAQAYPSQRLSQFFRHEFGTSNFDSTRQALLTRIDWLLGLPHVEAMICGEPNFHLEKAIEERKFVLVNLASFGALGSRAVGKLFVAMIGAIGRRRHALPIERRTPTHVFIDEVSTMVSEDLLGNLKELRKFGVYQTLAQQVEGDGFTPSYRKVLAQNTGCKFLGSTAGELADILRAEVKLPALEKRNFWVRWPLQREVESISVRSDLAGYAHSVPVEEWERYESKLVGLYYSDASEFNAEPIVVADAPELPLTPGPFVPRGPMDFRPSLDGLHADDSGRVPTPGGGGRARKQRRS